MPLTDEDKHSGHQTQIPPWTMNQEPHCYQYRKPTWTARYVPDQQYIRDWHDVMWVGFAGQDGILAALGGNAVGAH